ncbi:hypothetical protein HDU81_001254 [Chytriomyces hyalinus]|nr:hypothetical protein HDU81_001254 [Chytriomyces hyalinus]
MSVPPQTILSTDSHPAFKATSTSVPVNQSYDAAVADCKDRVQRIAAACRKLNIKFRDRFFDLKLDGFECLTALFRSNQLDWTDFSELVSRNNGGDVARVPQVFENPAFFKDGGITPGDIRQGSEGDCWFLAALSILASVPSTLTKTMVARDEQVGVYGFVFYRDGQWISSIIDDQLCANYTDYKNTDTPLSKEEYEKMFLTGSRSLRFARAEDKNETWVPLIEKAYAKAHGDYESIAGGHGGEAVEDLTGGICGGMQIVDILDTDLFWKEEFMQMSKGKIFFLSMYSNSNGLYGGHEYSVLKAVEAKGKRLVLIRNPWGKAEWHGKWSDGSVEWTPEWMQILNHTFGDDGKFWMEYDDVLRQFDYLGKGTLFDNTWSVNKSHAELEAAFPAEFSPTVFDVSVTKDGPAFIVLSQVDSRYFFRLEGEYKYDLTFKILELVQGEDGTVKEADFAHPPTTTFSFLSRSTFIEFPHLPKGNYRIYPKVMAEAMHKAKSLDEVITENGQMGRHAKIEKQLKSFSMAKQISVLRTQKLKKEIQDKKDQEKKAAEAAKKEAEKKEAEKKAADEEAAKKAKEEAEKASSVENSTETLGAAGPDATSKAVEETVVVESAPGVTVVESAPAVEAVVESAPAVEAAVESAPAVDESPESAASTPAADVVAEGTAEAVATAAVEETVVEETAVEATVVEATTASSTEAVQTTTETATSATETPKSDEADKTDKTDAEEDADEKTEEAKDESVGTEEASIDFNLSASVFLRVYTKDPSLTVTTRFLDVEVEKFTLPENLLRPDDADPVADLYLSNGFIADFESTSVATYIKQKEKLNQSSGTSSSMKNAVPLQFDGGNQASAEENESKPQQINKRASIASSLRKSFLNIAGKLMN